MARYRRTELPEHQTHQLEEDNHMGLACNYITSPPFVVSLSLDGKVLWLTLCSYNSAVFASISSNHYYHYSVSESFLNSTECHNCTLGSGEKNSSSFWVNRDVRALEVLSMMWEKAREGKLARLEISECVDQYIKVIQSDRRNLLLVADDTQFASPDQNTFRNRSSVYDWALSSNNWRAEGAMSSDVGWICQNVSEYNRLTGTDTIPCSNYIDTIKNSPQTWRIADLPVQYCLSEKAEPHCKLRFDQTIMIITTILNLGRHLESNLFNTNFWFLLLTMP
jgi:hypothetical protein